MTERHNKSLKYALSVLQNDKVISIRDINFLRERHKSALNYAVSEIVKWQYAGSITEIYLYGSYARGEQGYDSDVDIYVVCSQGVPITALRELKMMVMPEDINLPEVEVKFGFRPLEMETDLFHVNIRKDGVLLWKR